MIDTAGREKLVLCTTNKFVRPDSHEVCKNRKGSSAIMAPSVENIGDG